VQVRVAPRPCGGNLGFSAGRVPQDSSQLRLVPLGATQFCEKAVDGVDDCVGWFNKLDFALVGETTAVEPNDNLRSWDESTDRGKVVSTNAPESEISVSVKGW
jgi:hypothetical protein